MSTIKTIGIFAVIVGCFAVLYPRFIHPITLRVFGLHKASESKDETPFRPPHQTGGGGGGGHGRPDMRQHMRPGPPPGLRAAAEMERERAQQASGRGMMGVVLPMYAVGIVLYLIYTLVKVFNKRSGDDRQSDDVSSFMNKEASSLFETNPMESNTSMEEFLKKQKNNELEKLLLKADDKDISCQEMRVLQKRLEETEAQMTNILKAMQTVSSKVDDVASTNPDLQDMMADSAKAAPNSNVLADKSTNQNKKQEDGEKSTKSTDSSSDMDSFEIVDRKKGSNSEASNNTDDDLSQSLSSEIVNIGTAYLPDTEPKITESCDKDLTSVAPESEQDVNEEAEGVTEELLPEDEAHEYTVRHRKLDK